MFDHGQDAHLGWVQHGVYRAAAEKNAGLPGVREKVIGSKHRAHFLKKGMGSLNLSVLIHQQQRTGPTACAKHKCAPSLLVWGELKKSCFGLLGLICLVSRQSAN